MLYQEEVPTVWVKTFGGLMNSDGTDETTAYNYHQYGINAGIEWDYKDSRIGITAGVANSKAKSSLQSFENKSNHVFVGAYGIFNLGNAKLSTAILTGLSGNDNKRYVYDNLNGLETASSDANSIFVSPTVNIWTAYSLSNGYEFRPFFGLVYNLAYIDSYTESGTTQSNLSVDSRNTHIISSKQQLAIAQRINNKEVELRGGINSRYSNDDSVSASVSGNAFDYSVAGDDFVYGLYAGCNLQIATRDNLIFTSDLEFGLAKHYETYVNANLMLKYLF